MENFRSMNKILVIKSCKNWRWVIIPCFLALILGNPIPTLASIHGYPESPTQTMYRSVQSFRDASHKAWQVVLYKRVNRGWWIRSICAWLAFPEWSSYRTQKTYKLRQELGKFGKLKMHSMNYLYPLMLASMLIANG